MTVFGQHRCAYCCIVAQVQLLVGGDSTTWYIELLTALREVVGDSRPTGISGSAGRGGQHTRAGVCGRVISATNSTAEFRLASQISKEIRRAEISTFV